MAGKGAWISNSMNRNTRVDGSKKIGRGATEAAELILEYDPSSPKGISSYNLEFEDELEEVHEKPNQGKNVEFVPFHSTRNSSGDTDEPEQVLEEELNEETEIESIAPRDYGTDSEEPKKDLDPEEELSEERKIDSPEESFAAYLSFHSRDLSELIEGRIENMSGEFSPKSFSNLSGQSFSKKKKRLWKLEAFEAGKLQAFQLRKKCRYEDTIKPESAIGDAPQELTGERVSKAISNSDEGISEQEEHAGSFGKRRHTRWGPEHDITTREDDSTSKRRKTRWASDDSLLKMLGPIDLPDFTRDSSESELDPEVQQLKMKLMEINRKLQSSELHDDRPEEERSPSPEPVYNNLGIRINTREVRLRKKLRNERASIICMLVKKNPTFKTPPKPKPSKIFKKIYVPVKEYPTYNFVGLIIGPRGNTHKKMEKETGAKISLRGKGSAKSSQKPGPFDNDDLHVYVEADNQKSLDAAVVMIEKLLIPVADGKNNHKRAQLAELAKLNGTYRGENRCNICREQGHKEYACPGRKSTFKGISCDSCGSFCHLVSDCPLSTSSQICQPSSSFSEVCIGLTPNMKRKSIKGIDSTILYAGYLSQKMESKRLKELFLPFGKISEAKVIKDRSTGLSKGYGFVKFENPIDAAAAVAHLNGYKMDGKVLEVRVAGHMALAGHSPLSNHAFSSVPMSSSSIQCQAACLPVPAASMLPQTPPGFANDENMSSPYSSICYNHDIRQSKSAADDLLPSVGSRYTSSIPSSNEFPNQILYASKYPGDPKYPGSRFQTYFTTPMVERSPNIPLNPVPEYYQKSVLGQPLCPFEEDT